MNYTEQDRLEAAEWFIDIHDVEDPSPDLLHDWMRWMEESEFHRSAFGAVERAWRDAAALAPNYGTGMGTTATGIATATGAGSANGTGPAIGDGDDYDGSVSVDVWLSRQPKIKARLGSTRRSHWSGAWLGIAAAAALGATALVLAPRLQHRAGKPAAAETFATRTGEQIQVTLPDGSQVSLGARSKLTVAFTREARDVRLEAGEAFFAVHKNAARPFRVHVLDGVVTAVGTAFDVRRTNDRVLVAVAEGVVQVNGAAAAAFRHPGAPTPGGREHAASPPVASLRRGEAISFLSRPGEHTLEPAAVTRVDPAEPARWRDGWLVYRDEPLRDVLTDIARYTDRDIVVDGNLAVNSHFTGAVFKDSIIEWLDSLPAAFPVTVTASGSRILVAPASKAQLGRGP